MTPIRLGAVGYLNARPLVYGLDREPRFELRYDIPSECARLLHAHAIDVGLIRRSSISAGRSLRVRFGLAVIASGRSRRWHLHAPEPREIRRSRWTRARARRSHLDGAARRVRRDPVAMMARI